MHSLTLASQWPSQQVCCRRTPRAVCGSSSAAVVGSSSVARSAQLSCGGQLPTRRLPPCTDARAWRRQRPHVAATAAAAAAVPAPARPAPPAPAPAAAAAAAAAALRGLYPALSPHATGHLRVSELHTLYYEVYGNPRGVPAVVLHGGPGAGCFPNHARFFDPAHYRIILLDQRGCGRSTPYGALAGNTTADLVADLEALRASLGVQQWLVLGGSWGVALALAYAQAHPCAVLGLVLRGVCLMRQQEVDWMFGGGAGALKPLSWAKFLEHLTPAERGTPLLSYYQRLLSADAGVRAAASKAWLAWEMAVGFSSSGQSTLVWDGAAWSEQPAPAAAGAAAQPQPQPQPAQQRQALPPPPRPAGRAAAAAAAAAAAGGGAPLPPRGVTGSGWWDSLQAAAGGANEGGEPIALTGHHSASSSSTATARRRRGGVTTAAGGSSGSSSVGDSRDTSAACDGASAAGQGGCSSSTSVPPSLAASPGATLGGVLRAAAASSAGARSAGAAVSAQLQALQRGLAHTGCAGGQGGSAQALLEAHYSVHGGFLQQAPLLQGQAVDRLRHIPCIAVQGQHDLVCPSRTAVDLGRAWPEAELRLVPQAGHSMYDPRITHELVCATDRMRALTPVSRGAPPTAARASTQRGVGVSAVAAVAAAAPAL